MKTERFLFFSIKKKYADHQFILIYYTGLKQNNFYILSPKKVTRAIQFILIHDIGLK